MPVSFLNVIPYFKGSAKMEKSRLTYIKNILLPCVLYSGITGFFTACLIFLFKLAVSKVVPLSQQLYTYVRDNPSFLPLLIIAVAVLGGVASLILHFSPSSRGGGIPTAITLLRGLTSFNWLTSIFLLFPSALMTYLCGIPLGTEGPAVQMGTAVGKGTVKIFAKKHLAWERFIMTGGASAGFAAATGSPLTAIFFAFEEAHSRFSPTLFMTSAVSAVTSTAVMQLLCPLAGLSSSMFHFSTEAVMPLVCIRAAVIVGLLCGLSGTAFTKLYSLIHTFIEKKLSRIPLSVKVITVFVATAIIGFFSADFLGSGDLIIEEILEGHAAIKLLVICLCVRAIMILVANNIGVTGGLFVPMLCFGAIIGGFSAKLMISAGLLSEEYYTVIVVIGIVSFLATTSRRRIMATVFAIEALGAINNLLPVMAGVTVAYITVETLGVHDFTDIVIESKLKKLRKGKPEKIIDRKFTVAEDSFAEGKQIRDILWPPTCTVLSVEKKPSRHHHSHTGINAGDVLEIHYHTFDEKESFESLEAILGKQR